MSTSNQGLGYYGDGQPPLQSGWLADWGSSWSSLGSATPAYYGQPCGGGGSHGRHGGHHTLLGLATGTPAYHLPPQPCGVVVQAPESVTVVQDVPATLPANECAAGPIAIVIPRSG